ncbi:LOW QUALITY PROTEIN: proline-rich protein 36 [Myxocyprinus asiaticus]|uniref:LOW QUALITY PROTEIN: proline-rich protein 36 n=1 Tax=Myxocyprinus asiaticus TaxID=70543 RepID=UPI0022221619|nr:LOW QUALITY PROTEIN: proline-rich protein 36 [Myxocyprinus asiaticus]
MVETRVDRLKQQAADSRPKNKINVVIDSDLKNKQNDTAFMDKLDKHSSDTGLQALLTQLKDTFASVNKPPTADPTTNAAGLKLPEPSPQAQLTYILSVLSPVGPPANPKLAQEPSAPQINLYISGIPQQNKPNAVQPPIQAPLQLTLVATPESLPGLPYPTQAVALPAPYNSILPQNTVVMPASMPLQAFPNMFAVPPQGSPLQSPALLGPQVNPYLQSVNPLLGPQNFGPYPFYPHMYPFKPYGNNCMPTVAISPPIIFRERRQTATTQV